MCSSSPSAPGTAPTSSRACGTAGITTVFVRPGWVVSYGIPARMGCRRWVCRLVISTYHVGWSVRPFDHRRSRQLVADPVAGQGLVGAGRQRTVEGFVPFHPRESARLVGERRSATVAAPVTPTFVYPPKGRAAANWVTGVVGVSSKTHEPTSDMRSHSAVSAR